MKNNGKAISFSYYKESDYLNLCGRMSNMAGSKFSRLGISSPMSIPHSSSFSATSRDDDVTEDDDFTEGDDVTEEDDADKVDFDAAITVADAVAILADDANVTTASDVIAEVVSVITVLAVSPEAIVVAVTALFFDSDSAFSSSSSICPSLIWASFRWKKEPPDGEERGADTTLR
jgi:hypothetical protein